MKMELKDMKEILKIINMKEKENYIVKKELKDMKVIIKMENPKEKG